MALTASKGRSARASCSLSTRVRSARTCAAKVSSKQQQGGSGQQRWSATTLSRCRSRRAGGRGQAAGHRATHAAVSQQNNLFLGILAGCRLSVPRSSPYKGASMTVTQGHCTCTRSSWSIPTLPTSFSTTRICGRDDQRLAAGLWNAALAASDTFWSVCWRMCRMRVVFPEPRKPVITVTGTFDLAQKKWE